MGEKTQGLSDFGREKVWRTARRSIGYAVMPRCFVGAKVMTFLTKTVGQPKALLALEYGSQ